MATIRAADMPTFDVPGFHFIGHTAPSRGATEISTWRLEIEPGALSEAHWLDHEEIFLLLDGEFTAQVAEEEIHLRAGDALAVPPRSLLQIANRSQLKASVIVCLPVGAQGTSASGHVIGIPPWAR